MANILLLYDTNEQDLARDFKDLLEELNVGNIELIPLSPDQGYTLEEKERHYFNLAEGAIFIITAGSERQGKFYPSPSLTQEMMLAKIKFENKPENLIYLVDESCNLPAIDQKAYIKFNKNDIRSVMEALIKLIKNLKSAALFRTIPIPAQTVQPDKKLDLASFSNTLDASIKNVLFDMSHRLNSYIGDSDLNDLLTIKYKLNIQEVNLLKQDLERLQVVIHQFTDKPYYMNSWWLSNIGWEVVRLEVEQKKKEDSKKMAGLGDMLVRRNIINKLVNESK